MLALGLAGCGQAPESGVNQTPAGQVVTVDDTPREPALVDEAARLLDLRTLPVMETGKVAGKRSLFWLNYPVQADVKKAFQFQRQLFTERSWKELSDFRNEGTYMQSFFTREGFVASVSVSELSDMPGWVDVSIHNYGNIRPAKLPVPTDAKADYQFPHLAGYVTTAKLAGTAEACRKLLLQQGWQPYGGHGYDHKFSAGQSLEFKRNAILLEVSVTTHENRPGQTMITYSTRLLSADLPALANAKDVSYDDTDQTLHYETTDKVDDVADFYRQELAKQAWKPTTEPKGLISMAMVFFNPKKDMLTLDIDGRTGATQVTVRYYTAAERAEIDRLLKAEQERRAKRDKTTPKLPKE